MAFKRELLERLDSDRDGLADWLGVAIHWQDQCPETFVLDRLAVHLHGKADPPFELDSECSDDEDDEDDEAEEAASLRADDVVATVHALRNGVLDSCDISGEPLADRLSRTEFIELVRERIRRVKDVDQKVQISDDGNVTYKGKPVAKVIKDHGDEDHYAWLTRINNYATAE